MINSKPDLVLTNLKQAHTFCRMLEHQLDIMAGGFGSHKVNHGDIRIVRYWTSRIENSVLDAYLSNFPEEKEHDA